MKTARKNLPIINITGVVLIVALVIAFLAIPLAVSLVPRPHPNPPSDQELIEHFIHYKTEFNRLATMLINQDHRLAVFPDTNQCQVGETMIDAKEDPNCSELVQYFQSLRLEWAYGGTEPLWLPIYNWGLSVSGYRKGYLYTVNESSVQDMGQIVLSTETSCNMPCLRRIDTNWYIYVDD